MITHTLQLITEQTLLRSQQIMKVPLIPCQFENHFQMPYQYICLNPQCLKNSYQLCCIYCCQQMHCDHLHHVQALKMLLSQFNKSIRQTQFGAAQILLNGIGRCRNQRDLRQNVAEVINFNIGGERFEKIIDRNNQLQRDETKQFYEQRNNDDKLEKTIKKEKRNALQVDTQFITPLLTFSAEDAIEQGFELKSPFCVVNSTQKLVTAFAYPPLNRFQDSVEINIKVEKITPFWLGIGVSVGRKKFQPDSKDHLIITSNGWISSFGKLVKTDVKYCLKDTVKVKYDKRMKLVEFIANSQKHAIPFEAKWNQQIFLCCVIFYKDDCVQLLA